MNKGFSKYIKVLVGLLFFQLAFLFISVECLADGQTYYIDHENGSDENDGLSENNAFLSLDAINSRVFTQGDSILLKCNGIWEGQLWPKGSGEEGNPISIGCYGEGNRPIINGNGVNETIRLFNQQYIEINDLEITNTTSEDGNRRGVGISGDTGGILNHVYLNNLYIHDVRGDYYKKDSGGILYYGDVMYNDVLVENCMIRDVFRSGIVVAYAKKGSTNVVIRNNYVDRIGGDGILACSCKSPLIEYNISKEANYRYGSGQYNVAIWAFDCDDALFQYNEAFLTRNTNDGQGFDCDYLCNGTTFQYNYSHDNEGGFMLICSVNNLPDYQSYNRNSTIRYNISQNDRTRIFQVHSKGTQGTQIYNNTIFIGESLSPRIYDFELWRKPGAVKSYNNIIYNKGGGWYYWGLQNYHVFENNLFFGNHPSSEPYDPYKKTQDPLLYNAGSGAEGIESVQGYKLMENSPCINTGKYIKDAGEFDYFGNSIYNGLPDIGAHEYSDTLFPDEPQPVEQEKCIYSCNAGNRFELLNYIGQWKYGDYDSWSNHVGDEVKLDFKGKSIEIFGSKDDFYGKVAIKIDDGEEEIVDLYNHTRVVNQKLYEKNFSEETHQLTIRILSEKNQSSSGTNFSLEKIIIHR